MLDALPFRIAQRILCRKEIPIQNATGILVTEGSFVYPDTPLMQVPVTNPPVSVPAAGLIGVRPRELSRFLVKITGDSVREGEVIARRKGLPFSPVRECVAPITGQIEFVDYEEGRVILSQESTSTVVPCNAFGTVITVIPGDVVVVELSAFVIDCILGRGAGAVGKIKVVSSDNKVEIEREKLDSSLADSLLVGGLLSRDDSLYLAQRYGARGIIIGGLHAMGHESWMGSSAKLPLTMAVTDGFGIPGMNPIIFECLKAHEGYEAWLNPLTNGRAEILINDEIAMPRRTEQKPRIEVGSVVRLIGGPVFTELATVIDIPSNKSSVVEGISHHTVTVRLKDGSVIDVPRPNVELLIL